MVTSWHLFLACVRLKVLGNGAPGQLKTRMYAVITTGGKQYLVHEGQKLKVEKLEQNEGDILTFEAMLVADDEGASVKVGTPIVTGSKVTAKVVAQGRADKVSIIKFKPKVRYRRNVGHRQPFTEIEIVSIN